MAKKVEEQSGIKVSTLLLLAGVGLAGYAIYRAINPGVAAAALPAPGPSPAPGSPVGTPVATVGHGARYRYWADTMPSWYGLYQSGGMTAGALNAKLQEAGQLINLDAAQGNLTSADVQELNTLRNSLMA